MGWEEADFGGQSLGRRPTRTRKEDGNDWIHGGAKGDWLLGEDGDDTVYGGAGRDHLEGNAGDDYNNGGPGFDLCAAEVEIGCEGDPF